MEFRLFHQNVSGVFLAFGRTYDVKFLAKSLSANIFRQVNSGAAQTIKFKAAFVDDRAQLHCDKWIEETATHMACYSAAQELSRPKLFVPNLSSKLEPELRRLLIQYKAFSGDVSGVIGEALFSAILVQHFGLNDTDFAHFRADKLSGIFPDFGIFRLSTDLEAKLNWNGVPLRTNGPCLPAEVKTLSTSSVADMREKLRRAIQQVQNFWIRVNGGVMRHDEAAVICLVIRNQDRAAYDIVLIWAR
jgi:hypothetical protein